MLLLPTLELLRTLYPGAYVWGATDPTPPFQEVGELFLVKRTHTGAARVELFPGWVDPSPIRPSLLVGAHSYLSPVTRGFSYGGGRWSQERVSTYKG